jgi:hypothetical protein
MNSNDLTRQQCVDLFEQLGPHMAYFRRLEERMYARAFPDGDEIFAMVKSLAKTSHELRCALHERSRLLMNREVS